MGRAESGGFVGSGHASIIFDELLSCRGQMLGDRSARGSTVHSCFVIFCLSRQAHSWTPPQPPRLPPFPCDKCRRVPLLYCPEDSVHPLPARHRVHLAFWMRSPDTRTRLLSACFVR